MTQTTDLPPEEAIDPIDTITLRIAGLAQQFRVPFRAAGLRAVHLGLVDRREWDALLAKAAVEVANNAE